jgi:hypothetical protein
MFYAGGGAVFAAAAAAALFLIAAAIATFWIFLWNVEHRDKCVSFRVLGRKMDATGLYYSINVLFCGYEFSNIGAMRNGQRHSR